MDWQTTVWQNSDSGIGHLQRISAYSGRDAVESAMAFCGNLAEAEFSEPPTDNDTVPI